MSDITTPGTEERDGLAAVIRPIWLLDVDGVINAVGGTVPDGYERRRINGFLITWPTAVVARMRELHETDAVEIRWLTTWCEDAANLIAPALGLPLDCIVEGSDDHKASGKYGVHGWWKSITAQRITEAEPDRPLIWTDDDLDYAETRGEVDWLKARTAPTLCYAPDPRQGITPKWLQRIEDFISSSRSLEAVDV